jgi:hypothetical protein
MQSDLNLMDAHRELLELDRTISELWEKFGDHVEDKQEFIEAEARRFAALECLATVQARSPEGMLAKATALKVASITEDVHRQAAIGLSLASDVLWHFRQAV